jgi:hypothetical protein
MTEARDLMKHLFSELESDIVESLEDWVGPHMQRLAKARAPVRRTVQRKRRANRSGLTASFVDIESGKKVTPQVALSRIAAHRNRGEQVQREIKAGNYSDFMPDEDTGYRGLQLKHLTWTEKGQQGQTIHKGYDLYARKTKGQKYISRVVRTLEGEKMGLKAPHKGLFFNIKTGRFQMGGFLRESIKSDELAMGEGNRVFSISCVAHADYAQAVEFGRQNGDRGQTKARPFMIPALYDTFEKIDVLLGKGARSWR